MNKGMRKAQSVLNYAVLWSVVVLALFVMWAFLRATIQGRVRQDTNSFSDEQYDTSSSESFSTRILAEKPSVSVRWYR